MRIAVIGNGSRDFSWRTAESEPSSCCLPRPYGTAMTTFPRLCPVSTYLCASTMWSRA